MSGREYPTYAYPICVLYWFEPMTKSFTKSRKEPFSHPFRGFHVIQIQIEHYDITMVTY